MSIENPESQSKPKRAKLNFAQIQESLYSHPDFATLVANHGAAAAALLPRIWVRVGFEKDARLLRRKISGLGLQLGIQPSQTDQILDFLLELGFLVLDGEYLTHPDIAEKQEKVAEQREKWRGKKAEQRGRRDLVPDVPEVSPGTPEGQITVPQDSFRSQPKPLPQPSDQKEMEAPRTIPILPDGKPDFKAMLEPELEKPNGQPWANASIYMQTGRRPMRKYPKIHISLNELIDVAEDFNRSGIPPDRWGRAFKAVQGRLDTPNQNGRSKEQFVSSYNWLIGWAKQELLDSLTKEQRFKNSQGAA